MRCGITTTLHPVACSRQNDPLAHRDSADRHLTAPPSRTRDTKRAVHEALVRLDRYPTATSGSSIFRSGRSTTRMVSSTKRTRSNVMQFTGQWSSQILQLVQRS